MENQNGIPISKRQITGAGAMWLIMELSKSTAEHATLAMIFITALAVAYMVADEIKSRRKR